MDPSSCSVRGDGIPSGSECADLQAVVEHLHLVDADGDGIVSPGASATLYLTLRDVSGRGFSWYPGVVVESDPSEVEVQDSYGWLYALSPCEGAQLAIPVRFPEPLAPGTRVRFTARADVVQHSPCIGTHAATISVRME